MTFHGRGSPWSEDIASSSSIAAIIFIVKRWVRQTNLRQEFIRRQPLSILVHSSQHARIEPGLLVLPALNKGIDRLIGNVPDAFGVVALADPLDSKASLVFVRLEPHGRQYDDISRSGHRVDFRHEAYGADQGIVLWIAENTLEVIRHQDVLIVLRQAAMHKTSGDARLAS